MRTETQPPSLQAGDPSILASIVESFEQAIISLTLAGEETSWNPAAERLYGYSADQMIGSSLERLIPKEQCGEWQERLARHPRGEHPVEWLTERLHRAGHRFPVLLILSPIQYQPGEMIGITELALPHPHKLTAEAPGQATESHFRSLFEHTDEGIVLIGEDGCILEWNRALESITGFKRIEVLGQPAWEMMYRLLPDENKSADRLQDIKYQMQQVLKTGDAPFIHNPIQIKVKRADGSICFVEERLFMICTATGWRIGGISIDVTGRRQTELALQENERRLTNLMGNLPGMAYRCRNTADWRMEFVSPGCQELTGYPAEALLHNQVVAYGDLIHPQDRQMVWDEVQQGLREKRPFRMTYRITCAEGREKWVWEQGVGVGNSENGEIILEGFITDTTESKQAEISLRDSHERFLTIIDSLNAHVYVADMHTYEILLVNEKMRVDFGDELVGKTCYKVFRGAEQICPHCTNIRLLNDDGIPTAGVTWESHNPITKRWYLNYDRAIKWVDHRMVRIQIATDITQRKQAEERLEYLSNHDALTGLYNRLFFEAELERLQNSRQFPISIAMVDVDGMKKINDSYGHAAGDQLLCRAAAVLRSSFRNEDVIARIGGDEFAILLTHTSEKDIQWIVQRISEVISGNNLESTPQNVSLSIGFATAQEGDCLSDILIESDRRMYQQKSSKTGNGKRYDLPGQREEHP